MARRYENEKPNVRTTKGGNKEIFFERNIRQRYAQI